MTRGRGVVIGVLAVLVCLAVGIALLVRGRADASPPAGTEPIGMACATATVDGSPIGFEEQQDFIRRGVPATLYRTPGMYWVVYPSTGGTERTFAKPDATWVLDTSAAARRTCSAFLASPSPHASS